MAKHSITTRSQRTAQGWTILVQVAEGDGESRHAVEVSEGDLEALVDSSCSPEDLVRESFEFLLEREPKESILPEFGILVIEKYFPEYREEIKRRLP